MPREWSKQREAKYLHALSLRVTEELLNKIIEQAELAGVSRCSIARDLLIDGWESRFGEVIQ